jgi:hypothetical protein
MRRLIPLFTALLAGVIGFYAGVDYFISEMFGVPFYYVVLGQLGGLIQ